MISALQEHLPELSWTDPNGGFYVWLTLPPHLDSKAMLPRAVTELVAYTPGTAFYADGSGAQNIRLSFCYPTPENIRVGHPPPCQRHQRRAAICSTPSRAPVCSSRQPRATAPAPTSPTDLR